METATAMDNVKAFNMIVLGAYLKVQPIVSLEAVMTGLKKSLPERHHKLLPMNQAALIKGGELVERDSVEA
jgi:2-oxoglutarate ferredoxin oxidoreductase subunit gamma